MILTEIGEVGVHVGGKTYLLRPSLYAMSLLGSPEEIVQIYASLMAEQTTAIGRREQFRDALSVIHACSEEDVSDVFGYLNEKLKYVVKRADPSDIVVLGRHLMRHGVVGELPELPRRADSEPEYTNEFSARDRVATAMAHLGFSEQDAWRTTMTALVSALRSKYPPKSEDTPGAKAPTPEENEATMAWYERVLEKRKGRLH